MMLKYTVTDYTTIAIILFCYVIASNSMNVQRRNVATVDPCSNNADAYTKLKDAVTTSAVKSETIHLLNLTDQKYFNMVSGNFWMSSTTKRMFLTPTKKRLDDFYPSGKEKPVAVYEYHSMLELLMSNVNDYLSVSNDTDMKLKLKVLWFDLNDLKTSLENTRKSLLKCSDYQKHGILNSNFNPKDLLYTHNELYIFFTINKTDSPTGLAHEKAVRTTLNAVKSVIFPLTKEVNQRHKCL